MSLKELILTGENSSEVKELILDEEAVQFAKINKEPIFVLSNNRLHKPQVIIDGDSLIDLEVTLRKGKRVGLLTN